MCLTCLNNACGRQENKHALNHYENNQDHPISINLKTLSLWCYKCDEDLMMINDYFAKQDDYDEDLGIFIENVLNSMRHFLGLVQTTERTNPD